MGRTTGFLTKGYTAASAIGKMRIVTFGAADGVIVQATATTDWPAGVSTDIDSVVGERSDVFMVGNIAPLVAGGAFSRKASITTDSQGRGIAATTAGQRCVGFSETSATQTGDIVTIIVQPHAFTVPA